MHRDYVSSFFCMLGMSLYPVFLLTPDTGPSTFLKTVQMG